MSDRKVIIILLSILATFVVGVVLYLLKSVLLPLVVAIFLSYLFKPLVIYLKKRRIPTALSLFVVLITIAGVLFGLTMVVYSSVESFIAEAPKYQDKVNSLVSSAMLTIEELGGRYNIPVSDLDWRSIFDLSSLTSVLTTGLGGTVSLLGTSIIVLLYMFFILAAAGNLNEKIVHYFAQDHSDRIGRIISNVDQQVRQYLFTKTLISLATGALTTIVLLLFGVDFALFWGFLAFILNYIPNVGSLLAEVFPVLMAFLQFDSVVTPIIILIILVGIQAVMGNVVEPKMMSFSLNLSPLVVLVALIFWGWLWGITGMILAVPVTAILKIIFENIDELEPVAQLMGNVPKTDTV